MLIGEPTVGVRRVELIIFEGMRRRGQPRRNWEDGIWSMT